jgi:hypothetical protein
MYTKKLLSVTAAVAIMTMGAMAFDTDSNGHIYKIDIPDQNSTVAHGTYTYDVNNTNASDSADRNLTLGIPSTKGDALIFPAFFSSGGWESDFTIINRSNKATVVKVVLYSAIDSKELRDFNIYLSAADVFRAKIKDGKLVSSDDSVTRSTSMSKDPITGAYTDSAEMASASKPFETTLVGGEDKGYIIAYGMMQVADVNQTKHTSSDDHPLNETYHKDHLTLWKDYRHLIDNCRTQNWRSGITGGIYTTSLPAPNINLDNCGEIVSAQINPDNNKADYNTTFENPGANLLGSIHLIGNDSKGTRAMKLNAVPITNFTPDDINMSLLWTEGEFASLQDRAIGPDTAGDTDAFADYNESIIDNDAAAFYSATNTYIFEFGNSKEDAVVITQPLKRTLIQLDTRNMGNANVGPSDDNNILANQIWGGVTYSRANYIDFYGSFTLNPGVYNDSEDYKTLSQASFMVSPATTSSSGYPGESTMISDFLSSAGYTSGYAYLDFNDKLPAIVTQMSSVEVGNNVETNWIYSARD